MRHWMALAAVLSLTGATSVSAGPWEDFLDRLSPDYLQRQRMLKLCETYGPKGSQAYAGCALQVEQQAARNRAIAAQGQTEVVAPMAFPQAPMPRHCMWVGQVWTCH